LVCKLLGTYFFVTGNNIAYIYPDIKTAFVGKFDRGLMVSKRVAMNKNICFPAKRLSLITVFLKILLSLLTKIM
jgi:hypothetical protein